MLKGLHQRVVSLIPSGQQVLDLACGHGTLAQMIAVQKDCSVTGIDLDASKIAEANRMVQKDDLKGLDFRLMDATDLSPFGDKVFDVALTSMAMHQFSPEVGLKVLMEMKRAASTIIVADYAWPMPGSLYGRLARAIEWIAGGEHHRNFLQYMKNGGMEPLLHKAGLNPGEPYFHSRGIMLVTICSSE